MRDKKTCHSTSSENRLLFTKWNLPNIFVNQEQEFDPILIFIFAIRCFFYIPAGSQCFFIYVLKWGSNKTHHFALNTVIYQKL